MKSARSRPTHSQRAAFTLVESVVSLGVFSLLCAGVLGAVLQQRRIAETNVYENTALILAQSYVEQIRSLPYNELAGASSTASAPLRLVGANTAGTALTDSEGGTLNNNEWTTETLFLDHNAAGSPVQPFTFRFLVSLVDLEARTATESNGVEVTLVYEFSRPDGRTVPTRRTLRTVRSAVPSY